MRIWLGGLDSNQDSQLQRLMSYQLNDLPAAGGQQKRPLARPIPTLLAKCNFVNCRLQGRLLDAFRLGCYIIFSRMILSGGAVAQLGARLDGIEEVVGSNPIGSTKFLRSSPHSDYSETLRC